MTPKEQLYLDLCGTMCSRVDDDDWLLEHDRASWDLAREIDTWLVTYVRDARVSVPQFTRNCERLFAIYSQRRTLDETHITSS